MKVSPVWGIGSNKVIGLLMGMQAGFTKYCCFLCLWDSRAVSQHYKQKDALLFLANTASRRILWWTLIRCFFLLFTSSLVWWRISWRCCTKIVLPSNTCLSCSQVLVLQSSKRASLPDLRSEKCWRILIFEELLNLKELRAWEAFKSVCSGFLGNIRVPDYQACIEKLLNSYEDMGCLMLLNIHFLHSHLNFFPPNLGTVSDEHGERFYQDITLMESTYQGKWNPGIMGDFYWMLLRDIPEAKCTRSSKKTHFWLSVVLWIG